MTVWRCGFCGHRGGFQQVWITGLAGVEAGLWQLQRAIDRQRRVDQRSGLDAGKVALDGNGAQSGTSWQFHSTGKDLVAAVDPRIAVIQVGADNKYGHPTDEVLDILRGRLVLRNDRQAARSRLSATGGRCG